MLRTFTVALALVAFPTLARAQNTSPTPDYGGGPRSGAGWGLGAPQPSRGADSWGGSSQAPGIVIPSSPAQPPGVLNPRVDSSMDIPLVIAGAVVFAAGYAAGVSAAAFYCPWCGPAPERLFVPFAHWWTSGTASLVLGILGTTLEVAGLIMLIVGLVRDGRYLVGQRAENPLAIRF